ncbi:biotin-dependent carboxyltransferase family protein [Vibrio rumoiensis]|uniref:Urea amidolyase n=1 Tax=Vibrio rumoiensis 1S-45 TaxID=1188252 RepID=A0A1E5E0R8_9VIBR|nr:biotin-dependent carboxyltransferase family protein [Vibrio rumoiensis]OEF23848.1 urea amidolyase [Vibrio rumoiensis 1S-45]
MNALQVLSPGVLSLIQDLGRQGVGHLGLSGGGPADLHAFCWANRLLGNPTNAAAIEITLGQVSFKAQCDVMLSLTGADMPASIDGMNLGNWRSFEMKKGQVLKLGYARKGLRSYLAVQGGVDAPSVYGSCATVVRNQLGGLADSQGRALQKGDSIPINNSPESTLEPQFVPPRFIPNYPQDVQIGVFETYQHDAFTQTQKREFYSNAYTVSDKLDRMGIRLQGNAIYPASDGIISEGIAPGSIQFPSNGQPIILASDRQTLGGYPKIGCVSKIGLMRLAQARPGTTLHFYPADIEEETTKYCEFLRFFGI